MFRIVGRIALSFLRAFLGGHINDALAEFFELIQSFFSTGVPRSWRTTLSVLSKLWPNRGQLVADQPAWVWPWQPGDSEPSWPTSCSATSSPSAAPRPSCRCRPSSSAEVPSASGFQKRLRRLCSEPSKVFLWPRFTEKLNFCDKTENHLLFWNCQILV